MLKKSREFYIRVALSVVAVLLVINLFNLPGSGFIKRTVAAIGTITGEGTINYLVRFAGASPSNSIVDSIIFDSGSRVGIGTDVPAGKLTVAGGYVTSGISGANVTLSGAGTSPNAGQLIFGDGTGWKFHFGTVVAGNFTERMTLQDNGNVGIGKTNPAQKLDVAGNIVSTGNMVAGGAGNFGSVEFYGVGGNSGQASAASGSGYRIYQAPGAWSAPYPDLNIAYRTGISIGAHYSYGGTRFYNDSDMVTELMSVGNTDNNVRIANNLIVNGNISSAGGLNVSGGDLTTYNRINVQTSNFSINNSVPAGIIGLYATGGVVPQGNNEGSLGTSALRWGDIYADVPPLSSGYVYVVTSATGQMAYLSSSRETKTDIQPLKRDWKDLLKLDPVMYRDKDNPEGQLVAGYIAEDAEKVGLFDLIAYHAGKIVSFYYDRMTVYLLEGLREHEKEISTLETELKLKTEKISDLETRIEKLEQIINNK